MDNRTEIENLIASVSHLRDQGDFEGVAKLFAHSTWRTMYAGTSAGHGVQFGEQEVLDVFQATVALYDGLPLTKYLTTNVNVDCDNDSSFASARADWLVLQACPGFPLQVVSAGRYVDRFAKIDGRWWFTDRLILADASGDLSHHLKMRPADYGASLIHTGA